MNSKSLFTILAAAIALAAGACVFVALEYVPFTLALHVKSLERGAREILVREAGNGREFRVGFEIGNDTGEPSVYSIELPPRNVASVTLPPLAGVGRYELERITLANRMVSYDWEGGGICTQHSSADVVGRRAPCGPGAPALSLQSDGAVVISAIPDTGLHRLLQSRLTAAVAVVIAVFLAGVYLLRPLRAVGAGERVETITARAGWILVAVLYLWQFGMLWAYSVDLPFYEEWEFFEPAALQRGLSLDWLFCHFGTNQQVMVFTKLMAWLDFKLFSLDFIKLKLMNYAVFGVFLAVLAGFVRRVAGDGFKLLPFLMIFLLSPIAYEAHAASFQSGEIFVLLFSMVMLHFSLSRILCDRDALIFSLASLCAMFSMHTGVGVAAILLFCRTVFILSGIARNEFPKQKGLRNIFISSALTVPGIIFWLSGFHKQPDAPPMLLPAQGKFWDQFLNLLSFGFGFDSHTMFPGLLVLLFLLVPAALLLANRSTRWQRSTWQAVPAILALLALTMMIAAGRGNMVGSIKLSRYTVYISPLILFGGVAWWLLLKGRRELYALLGGFWLFCCAAFSDNWDYAIYRDLHQMDMMNIECVEAYNSGRGDGVCPGTHGQPIGSYFDNARKLDINFTRQFGPRQPK